MSDTRMTTSHLPTLVHLLRARAAETPELRGHTFLVDDDEELHFTYAELDRKARAIAAALQDAGAAGERAVLLYPPGLDYVAAFFGCLYANVVAVPAYPPDPMRLGRTLPRLQAMIADARASVVLTTEFIASMAEGIFELAPELKERRWIATDALAPGVESGWREPEVRGDTLAFLQYTSGSTGTPKGVMLSHTNLLHNSKLISHGFAMGENPVGVIWLPPYHDMGLIGGILQPLYARLPVVLMSPLAFLQRPMRWLRAVSKYRGTVSGGPNFAYELCVRKSTPEERASLDLSSWDVAFCGAEPINPATLDRFVEAFGPSGFRREALYSCYGLAEATLIVSGGVKSEPPVVRGFEKEALSGGRAVGVSADARPEVTLVGCGRNLPDQRIAIVRPATAERCAPGEVGEIWVSGPSVAQGYWQRAEESERTFQAFIAGTGEGPFLRTGDLGFLQEDGELFVTGRLKDLLIIRGRNHYPQDLEASVERCHPALRPGCTAAFSVSRDGEEQLVIVQEVDKGYTPGEADGGLSGAASAMREAIASQHELRTSAIVLVAHGTIPKTSSGKIQRHAARRGFLEDSLEVVHAERLDAAPEDTSPAPRADMAEPAFAEDFLPGSQAEVAAWLVARLARSLRVPARTIELDRPLTAYGLDSLQAVELQNDLEERLGVRLPLTAVLRGPTPLELAEQILAAKSEAPAARLTAPTEAPSSDEQPLSEGQRALWFLHRLAPDSTAYSIVRSVRIPSELDVPALRRAFQTLVDRHPALRTTFAEGPRGPVQRVRERAEVAFQHEDVSGWTDAALHARLDEETHRPFDLEHGPLMRVSVLTRSPREHVLTLAVHHIIIDFWSLAVLVRELGAAYAAERSGSALVLAAPGADFSEWVRWQARTLAASEESHLAWWREHLADAPPAIDLPTDHPRPPVQTYRGASYSVRLGETLSHRLREVSREQGTTLFVTLLSAWYTLLQRYTGEQELVVGTPSAGRSRAGFAGVVGYFVNSLPLRANLSGDPAFTELLGRVRQTVLSALEHQDVPFSRLVERLQPQRDPSRSPLFQVAFALQQSHLADDPGLAPFALGDTGTRLELAGLTVESLPVSQRVAQFDLSLTLAETASGLAASLEYNSDLFEASTIERMAGHLGRLLEGIAARPGQRLSALPWVTEPEQRQLVEGWNDTGMQPAPFSCVQEQFEAQVAQTPDAPAVVYEGETLSYAEVNRRANQLAHHLRALGVGPEVKVAVLMERSLEAVVGFLGILKAGGAFVALDAGYPPARVSTLLRDAHVPVLLTHDAVPMDVSADVRHVVRLGTGGVDLSGERTDNPPGTTRAEQLAYVIYTSGSTGQPKGVMITHGNLANRMRWARRTHPMGPGDAMLQATSFSFDVAVWELLVPLLMGGRIVAARAARHHDVAELNRLMASQGVTTVGFVPSLLQALLEEGGLTRCTHLKDVFCGGEALPLELARRFTAAMPQVALHNLYGPTEGTIDSTYFRCAPEALGRSVPIGRPLGNVRAYVLDAHLQPVPVGVPGELFIGGSGLARGYLDRPDLTAERFLPDPFSREPGARLYRTGDRVRLRSDGNIEFLGRRDHQVKLRGFRLELGEIEAVLARHPSIKEVVVLARERDTRWPVEDATLARALEEIEQLSEAQAEALLSQEDVSLRVPTSGV